MVYAIKCVTSFKVSGLNFTELLRSEVKRKLNAFIFCYTFKDVLNANLRAITFIGMHLVPLDSVIKVFAYYLNTGKFNRKFSRIFHS